MLDRPNFFIIGGPKCGTTAMAKYLGEHDSVLMANPKEPHYFCSDLLVSKGRWEATSDDGYMDMFYSKMTKEGIEAMGEASVFYMFSEVAVKNILVFNPDAKFIVMVRNPADAAYSLFSQYSFAGWEVSNFMTAWELQEKRFNGKEIPKHYPNDAKLLQYGELYKFGEQIKRLYLNVKKENILVINYDDFNRNNREVYVECLQFIGAKNDGRNVFKKVNYSRTINNKYLHRFLRSQPLIQSAKFIKLVLGLKSLGFGRPQSKLSFEKRQEILKYYENDIELLSGLTGKDFSYWLTTKL